VQRFDKQNGVQEMITRDKGHRFSRRRFLTKAGTGLALAGLAPALSAPFISRARAATKTLKIIQGSHFVPAYDKWLDAFAQDWGNKNAVAVTVDHIPGLELPARAAAEAPAQAGHDLFALPGSVTHLYVKQLLDLSTLVAEIESKYGKVQPLGRQIAYDSDSNSWPAFPDYYVSFPGLYRKDLWDEIGMVPDTWEDILKGGAKLKAKGYPIGISLGHSNDANQTWRGLMWSYGATEVDQSGKQVTINSKETLEAVKLARAIYKEAMDPEVLSWDDAGNNRFLASGKGCWINNPISAYRTIQQSTPELADQIFLWKTPAGPVRRLVAAGPNSYSIWKFARNQDAALAFLRYYAEHWPEGFKASTGYNHPIFPNVVPQPMPFLSNDPSSHPPDKLKVLETANEWHAAYGYPGPAGPAAGEVANTFIIPDMMAGAATDKMTPEEAVAWADKQIHGIYKKWVA
jgi:multiple sugar transport system substrate-binding protein